MARTGIGVGIGVAAAAALAFGAYSYNQHQKQASLEKGISDTSHAIQEVEQEIQQNNTDLVALREELAIDSGKHLLDLAKELGKGPNGELDQPEAAQPDDLAKALANGFNPVTAYRNGEYLELLQRSGQTAAAIWETADPEGVGKILKVGEEGIDLLAKICEVESLIGRQAHLLDREMQLEMDLYTLQGKEFQTAEWRQKLDNLEGSAASEHERFLKWLDAHGIAKGDVVAKTLHNANQAGGATASQVAAGLKIIDPQLSVDQIAGIPGINPDFIAAMQADQFIATQAASDPRWLRYSVSHYPDGTYIPAFGPCRGIDIPNPIQGGLISSSMAACRSSASTSQGVTPAEEALRTSLLAAAKAAVPTVEAQEMGNITCGERREHPSVVHVTDVVVDSVSSVGGGVYYSYVLTFTNCGAPRNEKTWRPFLYDGAHWQIDPQGVP